METRRLGLSGLQVSALGLGCLGMSDFYGGRDEKESVATLNMAIDRGVTMLDTADFYGEGANEELIGRVVRERSEEMVVASKFGMVKDDRGHFTRVCGRPEYVREACDASLKRLGLDVIGLYYLHRVDPEVPIEETIGAMADLVATGKVMYLGLSEAAPATVRRAHAVQPISALQSEYSLWSRDPEGGILSVLRELDIGLVPYSPLGRGFLTGQITATDDLEAGDYRRTAPRFQDDALRKNLELVDEIKTIATDKNCSAAQLALAWVLAQGDNIVPIPGTKRRKYLEDNLGALDVTLDDADLRRIDAVLPPGVARGSRANDLTSMNR